jgi:uncharacterized repeat protein (TIGR01451 family)
VNYTITVTNESEVTAFADNIVDVMPDNMDLQSYSITYSGSIASLPNTLITQSGSELYIEYNT